MVENAVIGLTMIIVLGIGAQLLAWRLHLPSILLLVLIGFLAGPVINILDPDVLFGDLLLPVVSLAVAVILFEGGLNLKFAELRKTGGAVRNLITIGVLFTWIVGAGVSYLILGLEFDLAVLLGAILVVTGPTVVMPLLRFLRPNSRVSSILKWEGVVVDPIGAILAVIVFEVILASGGQNTTAIVVFGLLRTVLFGGAIGVLSAFLMVILLRRYWIPEFLHSVFTLMLVIVAFSVSNLLQSDSGLLAVTVMGIVLANHRAVDIKHISEFKENLRVLLISGLFIVLAARLELTALAYVGAGSLILLAVLLFLARPASVVLSTLGSKLSWRERLFVAWLAPRGIVAAAVSSVFALRLVERGYTQAEFLAPLTFMIIVGTVVIYGLSAPPLARLLEVAEPNPRGVLIVGGHGWARGIAGALQEQGYKVLLVDDNWANISAARMANLPGFYANILSQYAMDELELDGIGHMMAITSDDEFNSLVALQFTNVFGRARSYQLPPSANNGKGEHGMVSQHLRARLLFGPDANYDNLSTRFASGASVKTTSLTAKFDFEGFKSHYGDKAIPLFLIDENGGLLVFTVDSPPRPRPGQKLVSIIE